MPRSSFLAKLLENEVLGIQMKFETKLRNYIISKEQKYFVRTPKLFCQANHRILLSQQMILLDHQNIFVTSTEQFCKNNKETQQQKFHGSTKQFYCRNNNKILVGQAKPFSQCIHPKIDRTYT